ncbi:MAG: MOSC domain-containing protein [Candidatus Limnocylindria bacterium]
MNARVASLQLKRTHGKVPTPVDPVVGRVGGGFEGDLHVAKATRGVVVIDRSTHDALGLRPGDLREQVTVEGLQDLDSLAPGTQLRLGGITLRVNGPCEPCTHIGDMLDQADPEEFRQMLVGRRGVTCTVVAAEGVARVGDPVTMLSPVAA